MEQVVARRNYLSPVTASLNAVGSNRFFNINEWKQSIADGTLDYYVDLLMKSESLDIDDFNEKYKIPFGDRSMIQAALVNEIYPNKTPIKLGEYLGLEKKTKSLEEKVKEREMKAKGLEIPVDQYDVETTLYDQNVKKISEHNVEYAKQMLQQHYNEMRVNQQGFQTWLADAGMLVGNAVGGFYTGISKIAAAISSLFASINENNAGRIDDDYFDRVLYNFNKYVDIARIDSVADAFAEWEYEYTHLYDENGNQTRQGAILKSAASSLGEMVPSMVIGYGVGNAVGAIAGATGAATKTVSTVTNVARKVASKSLFYGANVFMTDAGEQYKYFSERGMSVPTGQVYLKAAVKTGLQWGVEWALGKVAGSTGIDRLKGMDETGLFSKALRKAKTPTGRAIRNFVVDALQEGAEEGFQETTDFLTDALFHYWNNDFASKEWSWQAVWDAAIAGAISSLMGGAARIIGTERVSVGKIKTNKEGELVFDEDGKPVYQTMNKLASYQYGLDMQSFVENYNAVIKAGEKLTKLDDGSGKYENAILQYKAAYTQALAAQQMIADYYGAVGKERFESANKVLESITEAMDQGKFDKSIIEANQKALAMDIDTLKDLTLKYTLKQIEEAVKKSGATEAENIVDAKNVDNLDLDDGLRESIKKIVEQNHNVGKVVITKDGNRVVSLEDFIIVPKHLLLGPSEAVTTAHAEGKMMDKLVEEIEKLAYKKNAIEVLKEIYRQWNHQQVGDYISTDEVIAALLFDNRFFGVVLATNEKLSCDFALTLNGVVRNAFEGNTLFDAMFKKRVNECIERWTQNALEFYANNLNGDASLFVQGLDKKQADDFKSELSKKLQLFNMGKTIVSNPSVVTKEVWDFIDRRIDNTRLSVDEKTRMKNLLRKGTAKQRVDILNTISSLYDYAFTSLYNGEYYMPIKGIQNQVFNHWLQNLGVNITNMFDPYRLTEVELSQIGETVDTVSESQIVEFRQQQFSNSTGNSMNFNLVDGKIVINDDMSNDGHLDFQQLIYEQIENPTLNKKIPVDLRQTVKILRDMLRSDVKESIGTILTVDDIIHNFAYLNDETYDSILDTYGTVNMMTVFRYVQKKLMEDTKGRYCVLTKTDGSFILGEMVNIETIFEKSIEFPSKDSKQIHMLAQYLKPKYRNTFVATASVRFNGNGNYYTPFETRYINGKPATVFANRITIDKRYTTKSEIMVALAHEITHVVQASWKLNAGLTHNVLNDFGEKAKKAIIAEVKSLHPELFEGKTGESDELIVNRFLYLSSGESVAFGLSNKISFYPIIVENNHGDVTITLENGKEFKVPRKVDETNSKNTIVASAKKTFDAVYKGKYNIKPTEDESRSNAMARAAADIRSRITQMENPVQNDYLELMYQMSKTNMTKEEFLDSDVLCMKVEEDFYYLTSTDELTFLLNFIYPKLKVDNYKTSLIISTIKPKYIDKFEHIDNVHGSGKISIDESKAGPLTQLQVGLSTFNANQEMFVDLTNFDGLFESFDYEFRNTIYSYNNFKGQSQPTQTLFEIERDLKKLGYTSNTVNLLVNDYFSHEMGVPLDTDFTSVKNEILENLTKSIHAKYNMLNDLKNKLGFKDMLLSTFLELDVPVVRYQRGHYDLTNDSILSVSICSNQDDLVNLLAGSQYGYISDDSSYRDGNLFFGTIKGKDIVLGVNNLLHELIIKNDSFSNFKRVDFVLPPVDMLMFYGHDVAGVEINDMDGSLESTPAKLSTATEKDTLRVCFIYEDDSVTFTPGIMDIKDVRDFIDLTLQKYDGKLPLLEPKSYMRHNDFVHRVDSQKYNQLLHLITNKYVEIRDLLRKKSRNYTVYIEYYDEMEVLQDVSGLAKFNTNTTMYNLPRDTSKNNDVYVTHVFAHELLHNVVMNLIDDENYSNEYLQNIENIYNKYIKFRRDYYYEDYIDETTYRVSSNDDMIPEDMSQGVVVDWFFAQYGFLEFQEFVAEITNLEFLQSFIDFGLDRNDADLLLTNMINWLNSIKPEELSSYLINPRNGQLYNTRQEEALVPKPEDGMFFGPLYQKGKIFTEESSLLNVCDISTKDTAGRQNLELLTTIIKKLGIDTTGKKLNEILKILISQESQESGLTDKFIQLLKTENGEGFTSLYVGNGIFLIVDGKPGVFKTYLDQREEHNSVQENKVEVKPEIKKSDVKVEETITLDDIRESISTGQDGIKKDPFPSRKRTKNKKDSKKKTPVEPKKQKYNPSIHRVHKGAIDKNAIETITDPAEMDQYPYDYKPGHKYLWRERVAVQKFLTDGGDVRIENVFNYYYANDNVSKRHVLKEEFKNTDLKYFEKVSDQIELAPEVQEFVIEQTGKKIDPVLREKVKNGTLKLQDLEDYIVNTDVKDIDAQTFTLIKKVLGQKNVRSAYELQQLTDDGIFIAGAIYKVLQTLKSNDPLRKLATVEFGKSTDKNSLYGTLLAIEQILLNNERLSDMYQMYKVGLNSSKGINSVTLSDVKKGKLEDADLDMQYIKEHIFKDCDGTIASLYHTIDIARAFKDPKRGWTSKYDKHKVASLQAKTGKGKYGEDVGSLEDMVADGDIFDIAEQLELYADDDNMVETIKDSYQESLIKTTKNDKLKRVLDLEHAGGKVLYSIISQKILNGKTSLKDTFLSDLDQEHFDNFAKLFSESKDKVSTYIDYINHLTSSELNNMFIIVGVINTITPSSTLSYFNFSLDYASKLTGSELDKQSILKLLKKVNLKPSQIGQRIRTAESTISTLLSETKHKNLFLKKHGDMFEKDKKGKIKLKDNVLKNGDDYKTSDELQPILETISKIRAAVRKGAYKSEKDYKNYNLANSGKNLDTFVNTLKKLNESTMQKIAYEGSTISVNVSENTDIPNIFKEMMANGIGESGKQRLSENKVQEISPYEDVVETEGERTYVKRIYKDTHLQTVLRDFIDVNANKLATMTQDEAMELINFLLNYKALVSEEQRPIVAAQEVLLAYFLKVSRYGADTEILYSFSDEIVTQMENKLDEMARFFGSGLSHWKTALSNLKVADVVRMEYYTKLGVKLDKEDVANLDKVVRYMGINPGKTSSQVNKALSEYNDTISEFNAAKIAYDKKPNQSNEARLHKAKSEVTKSEHRLEKYKSESDKSLIDMNRKFRESLQVFEETLLKKYKGTPSGFFDTALKIQRAMMLSAPSTWIRNVYSNVFVHVGNKATVKAGDVLYNIVTKFFPEKELREDLVDTQYDMRGEVSKTTIDYIHNMFIESGLIDTLIKGVSKYNLDDMGKLKSSESLTDMFLRATADEIYTMYGIRTGNESFNKFFNNIIQLVYKGMSDDKFIKGSAIKYFGHILEEDYQRYVKDTKRKHKLAYENAVKNKSFKGTYSEYSTSMPAEVKSLNEYLYKDGGNLYGINKNVVSAFAKATSLASFDYMRTPNIFTRIEKLLRDEWSEGAYYVYKQLFPFLSSSWNWFIESCRYTPAGLVKSITDLCKLENTIDRAYKQNEKGKSALPGEFAKYVAIRNLGKGAIGTLVWSVAIILGVAGRAGYDDDEESYVIYAGKHKIKIDDITGSKSFFMGLAFYEAFTKEGKSPVNAFTDVADVFLEDSLFEDVLNRLMYNNDSWGEALLDMPFNVIDMYYPNFLKSISRVFHQRDKNYSSNTFVKSLQKLIVNWLPLPEEWLGAQIQVNPYTGKAESFWNPAIFEGIVNYISPVDVTYPQVSDTQFKASQLGVKKAQLSGRYTVNDVDITLTASQKTTVNQMYGKLNNDDLNSLMSDGKKAKVKMPDGTFKELKYSQMTDKQKKAAIENIMSNNSSISKIYILTSSGQYKYYASDSEYSELKKLGVTKNVYRKTKKLSGFVKIS